MGWDATINQGPVSITNHVESALIQYHLKERLKANGWTIGPSGDGLAAYSAVGDVLVTNLAGAGGMGQASAWFAASDPSGRRHLLLHKGANYNEATLAVSHDAPFLGGSAVARAVSADEVNPRREAAISNAAFCTGAGAPIYYNIIVSDAAINGVWPFHLFIIRDLGATAAGIGHFACIPITDEHDTGDTDPCVWTADYQYLDGQRIWEASAANSKIVGWYDIAGAGKAWRGMAVSRGEWNGNPRNPPYSLVNPGQVARPDGLFSTHKAEFWLDTGAGGRYVKKGVSNWILAPTFYSSGQQLNRLCEDQNGEIYVNFTSGNTEGGVLAPGWPSTATCPMPNIVGVSTEHVEVSPQEIPAAVPPTITLVSPVAGAPIAADTAIVVDVTDDVGLSLVVLTCEIPAGGPHEVVWLRSAFSSYYSDSTVAVIAGGYRYTIRRRGGWTASPRFHCEAVDTGGSLGA